MEFLLNWIILIALGITILGVASYVFMGLALSGSAELEGIEHKWFAWIPILNIIILLKIGKKDVRYIWVFIGSIIVSFITSNSESGFLLIVDLALIIWTIVIQIQAYLVIASKYDINPAWFIVGIFLFPVSLIAYIIFYNKVKKINNEGFTETTINQVIPKKRNKVLLNIALVLIGINLAIIILPFIIAVIFPLSGFVQVGWVFILIGIYVIPITFIFLVIAFFIYYKR